MTEVTRVNGDLRVTGEVRGNTFNGITRGSIAQDTRIFNIPLTECRVHDALHTNLPGTPATDDLALDSGTAGTVAPTIDSSDGASTTITQKLALQVPVPAEYKDGESISLRVSAKMDTVSDTTATLDAEVRVIDREGAFGSELYTGLAISINAATYADVTFALTPAASVSAGDLLQVILTVAITDSATGSGVIARLGAIELVCSCQG